MHITLYIICWLHGNIQNWDENPQANKHIYIYNYVANEVSGLYRNHSRLSVCRCRFVSCPSLFFALTLLIIFDTWVRCSAYIHDFSTTGIFYLSVKFISFSCQTRNSCLLWHQHIIFVIWVYYHVTTCRVHSWSRDDVDFWPQDNISSVFGLQLFCPVT